MGCGQKSRVGEYIGDRDADRADWRSGRAVRLHIVPVQEGWAMVVGMQDSVCLSTEPLPRGSIWHLLKIRPTDHTDDLPLNPRWRALQLCLTTVPYNCALLGPSHHMIEIDMNKGKCHVKAAC